MSKFFFYEDGAIRLDQIAAVVRDDPYYRVVLMNVHMTNGSGGTFKHTETMPYVTISQEDAIDLFDLLERKG